MTPEPWRRPKPPLALKGKAALKSLSIRIGFEKQRIEHLRANCCDFLKNIEHLSGEERIKALLSYDRELMRRKIEKATMESEYRLEALKEEFPSVFFD